MGVENPRIGVSFFVVAHTANLIAGFRIEGSLFQRRVRARPRPPVSGFFYCSLGGRLHDLLTERSAVLAFNVPQLLPLLVGCAVRMPSEALAATGSLKGFFRQAYPAAAAK